MLKLKSLQTGFSFGLTSGIITTLGLMVGLHAGTHSKLAVIGGILTIAVADAFSDALGIHVSQESENEHPAAEVWTSALSTFVSKLVFALTFVIPVLIFPLAWAIFISVIWGLTLLSLFSIFVARKAKADPVKVVAEHFVIALVVILITHYLGDWISQTFR